MPWTEFRDFDESDLDSYLEGSVWSEKPSGLEYYAENPDEIITVFPSTSHTNMALGYPARSCETVFVSVKIPNKNLKSV